MADTVQYRLERMTDELDDLERRGLFTRAELADVVRKRRDFEYRLRRHSPLRQDFLDYIAYELRLDSLRNLRKRAIIRAADDEEEPQHEVRSSDDEVGGRKRKKGNPRRSGRSPSPTSPASSASSTSTGWPPSGSRATSTSGSATSSSAATSDTAG